MTKNSDNCLSLLNECSFVQSGNVQNVRPLIRCSTCSKELNVRLARTGKPYIVCPSCGVQIFYRFKTGIERLNALLSQSTPAVSIPLTFPGTTKSANKTRKFRSKTKSAATREKKIVR